MTEQICDVLQGTLSGHCPEQKYSPILSDSPSETQEFQFLRDGDVHGDLDLYCEASRYIQSRCIKTFEEMLGEIQTKIPVKASNFDVLSESESYALPTELEESTLPKMGDKTVLFSSGMQSTLDGSHYSSMDMKTLSDSLTVNTGCNIQINNPNQIKDPETKCLSEDDVTNVNHSNGNDFLSHHKIGILSSAKSPDPLYQFDYQTNELANLACEEPINSVDKCDLNSNDEYIEMNETVDSSQSVPCVVRVPLVQRVLHRNRYIEVPEIHVKEVVQPRVTVKDVIREVQVPEVEWVEKVVNVPKTVEIEKQVDRVVFTPKTVQVRKPVYEPRIVHVTKVEYKVIDEPVQILEVKFVDKYVEKLEYRDNIVYCDREEIVEVPVEKETRVPKVNIVYVEKLREVDSGEIDVIDRPVEKVVNRAVVETVENIIEVPDFQDVIIEQLIEVPVQGEIVEYPYEVPVYVDEPEYRETIVDVRTVYKDKVFEKIIENPIPVKHKEYDVVRVPVEVPLEVIKHVDVPVYIDKVVELPKYVPFKTPPTIIQAIPVQEIIEVDPIYEKGPCRFIYDSTDAGSPEYAPAIFVDSCNDSLSHTVGSPPLYGVQNRQMSGRSSPFGSNDYSFYGPSKFNAAGIDRFQQEMNARNMLGSRVRGLDPHAGLGQPFNIHRGIRYPLAVPAELSPT